MNESLGHEYYEDLCALAAPGQLSAEKFAELSNHIRSCARCQSAYASFRQILGAQFLQDEKQHAWSKKLTEFFLILRNKRHKKLFFSRAKELGFRLPEKAEMHRSFWDKFSDLTWSPASWAYASVFIIIALVLILGVRSYQWREENAAQSIELAILGRENSSLRDATGSFRQQAEALQEEVSSLRTQLSTAHQESSVLTNRYNQLESELQKASLALQSLKVEKAASREVADNKLQEAQQTLDAVREELQSMRQAGSKDASLITVQQLELEELSRKLRGQTAVLERERRLMVADRDIRELMGARNLHIYDVFDFDSKGTNKQSFGRVFYTEGESLIFYAFDLEEAIFAKARHSFQVWGQRKDRKGPAVSLGVFYIDNAEQRRWVLKFEDRAVLSQINAVFVTAEPFGGGKQPTGEKLLYAFLSNEPNHP